MYKSVYVADYVCGHNTHKYAQTVDAHKHKISVDSVSVIHLAW